MAESRRETVVPEKSMEEPLTWNSISNIAHLKLITCGKSMRDRGASPWNSPELSTLFKFVAYYKFLTKDVLASPTTNDHHKFVAQVKYRMPSQTAVLNKSASRHHCNIKHNRTTAGEVVPGRKTDSLKYVDPTNSHRVLMTISYETTKLTKRRHNYHHAAWQEELMWLPGKEIQNRTVTGSTNSPLCIYDFIVNISRW